jgi:hypothetical protein
MLLLCDVTQCGLVYWYQRFEEHTASGYSLEGVIGLVFGEKRTSNFISGRHISWFMEHAFHCQVHPSFVIGIYSDILQHSPHLHTIFCKIPFNIIISTLTLHEEIKSRLNSRNACYHSVQGILSSRLLSRNVKVKIYKIIILPIVLYGCKTWVSQAKGRA